MIEASSKNGFKSKLRVRQVNALQARIRQKQVVISASSRATEKMSKQDRRSNLKEAFRNENGAIDLASIMVGIIVIGLIGGVIAATVFAVIPWSQDNAAKHQLDSIVAAQSAYMGLSSDSPPALPSGHKANSFADSTALASANLLQAGSTYCAVTIDAGKGYQGLSQSSSGKVFSATDKKTKPTDLGFGSIAPDCSFVAGPGDDSATGDNESGAEVPYVDPTPTITTLTYMCGTTTNGIMPLKGALIGTETWARADGVPITSPTTIHNGSAQGASRTLTANIEYKVTFEGTYNSLDSGSTYLHNCVRSLDHWGSEAGVTDASSGFMNTSNLVSVPEHIPSTVTKMTNMFTGATKFNDPNVSNWDVSNVTTMGGMFRNAFIFDQPLNDWNVSNVTSMYLMFNNARAFDQPLNEWKTGKVGNMSNLFEGAWKFNQPLDKWDVSQVTTMKATFRDAFMFDQNLSMWNVDNITNTGYVEFASGSLIDGKTELLPKF